MRQPAVPLIPRPARTVALANKRRDRSVTTMVHGGSQWLKEKLGRQRRNPDNGCWSAMLGLTILVMLGSQPAMAQSEAVPDSDPHLTRTELRWCLFEEVRIGGEGGEVNQNKQWEVDRYNGMIDTFNDHCQNKRYWERDHRAVNSELTPGKREALVRAGSARLVAARAERQRRRMYVKDRTAIIRTAPTDAGAEVKRVERWGELIATGKIQGRWYEVKWNEPSLDTVLRFGWVLGGLLERGSGPQARFDHCETKAGRRAQHNEVVRGATERTTARALSVQNGTSNDAYIKLVNERGEASVTFFVAKGRSARVSGIPEGSYELVFATGTLFSRGCDSFSQPIFAARFAERLTFGADGSRWVVTLHSVMDGNTRTLAMDYDDFDWL